MAVSPIGPLAAVFVSKRRRHIIDSFARAGAVTPAAACSLSDLGLERGWLFEVQRLRGVLVEVDEHRFYLDPVRERAVSRFRKALAGVVVVITAVVIVAIWYFGRT